MGLCHCESMGYRYAIQIGNVRFANSMPLALVKALDY